MLCGRTGTVFFRPYAHRHTALKVPVVAYFKKPNDQRQDEGGIRAGYSCPSEYDGALRCLKL